MSWGFSEIGMTQSVIERGIDAMKGRQFNSRELSGKVYLVDPRDEQLWDLKIVLRVAAEEAGIELYPKFTSDRYRKDLLKIGVSYVRFSHDAKRNLGMNGDDLSELLDAHELFTPDGNAVPMGMQLRIDTAGQEGVGEVGAEKNIAYESRVKKWHLSYERRVGNAHYIKEKRGLICEGCGLDAEAAFGHEFAMSCIEAHHRKPVAEIPPEGRQVKVSDFTVLCATCHRLIHQLASPDDLDGLRDLVKGVWEQ